MAATITPWVKSTETIANGGKTLSDIYNKCTYVQVSGHEEVFTDKFNWAVTTDFTIMFNVAGGNTTTDTTFTIKVQGSGDGTHWFDLDSYSPATDDTDTKVYMAVYDYDEKGRAPYMRLSIERSDHSMDGIVHIIGIIPHT